MGTLEKAIEADGSYQIEGSGSQVPFQRLPVDIVLEILLQRPFEYLGRLKCVGSAFNSLLKDPVMTQPRPGKILSALGLNKARTDLFLGHLYTPKRVLTIKV
ncbi:hypothetical protein WN944_025791 [Citrus x changshan-huyou]|uniref:F-box domain-containing protein n=1 Tax=Citrus x changshan-huyou TaxID=2935761 RepID=A0AAP0QDY0_9ROSI